MNYAKRKKVELSLWDPDLISSFEQQILSQFLIELNESHNIEELSSIKENAKIYSEYCINLFCATKSNINNLSFGFISL